MLHHLDTQSSIRNIFDSILYYDNVGDKIGVYMGFDMRINTEKDNFDQRSIALGVHLFRWYGNILGSVDTKFLSMNFDVNNEWEFISQHSSCWADSTMFYFDNIVRDVMKNKNNSKYCERYKDDNITFSDKYDVSIRMNGIKIMHKNEFASLIYNDNGKKHKLVY